MDLQTVLFIGCAGSGKGTQAGLLKEFLEQNDTSRPTHHIVTGDKFREFVGGDTSFAQRQARKIIEAGGLMPSFLPIWIWSGILVEQVQGNEHLLIDGFPRRHEEAVALDSALTFFDRKKPVVIVFDVEVAEVRKRLLEGRQRADDTEEEIIRRLAWYRTDVLPCVEYFKEQSHYQVYDVDANRTVEEIQHDVRALLSLA